MSDADLIAACGEALETSSMYRAGLTDRDFNFLEGLRHQADEDDGIRLSEPQRDWLNDIAEFLQVGP